MEERKNKMSAYIVNDETISVIVKGFVEYGVYYAADDYHPERKDRFHNIGQSLLNQNYKSVNHRYNESTKPRSFQYTNIDINEGMLLGCIDCYEYQACETPDFFDSPIHTCLLRLKQAILEKLIKEKGQEIPWGYEG